jgi:hypothetical protein
LLTFLPRLASNHDLISLYLGLQVWATISGLHTHFLSPLSEDPPTKIHPHWANEKKNSR